MNQYCRYCCHLVVGDANYCTKHERTMSDTSAKTLNRCRDFAYNPMDAFLENEKGYTPRQPKKEQCDGQINLFDLLGNTVLPVPETDIVEVQPPKKRNCAATNEECNHENCKQVAIECLDIDCQAECCQACVEICGARCNYSAHQPKKLNTETKEWVEVPDVDKYDGFVNLSVNGKCEYCVYYRDPTSEQGRWYLERHYGATPCILSERVIDKKDGICKHWFPDRLYGLCQTCRYSNMFVYQGEYKNPTEEPNIYCTHRDGSKNRHCAFPELVSHMWNGLDSWHREHEYDTCDNYKPRNGVERV